VLFVNMAKERISDSVKHRLRQFGQLLSLGVTVSDSSQHLVFNTLQDEETRFKVWCGNIGAHKAGRSSLEYRLRDASHVQKQVLKLLGDLGSLIDDAVAIIAGEKTPWDQLEDCMDPLDDEAVDDVQDEGLPETELGQISTEVADVVNCLLRLSLTIRNPAPHDRFVASAQTDTSHYEPFDTHHVRAKFGAVNEALAERLGKAISRRRQYFKYRENHHSKLCHGLDDNTEQGAESTIASSIPKHLKDATAVSAIPVVDEDTRSDAGVSQTSFASSIGDSTKLRVPPLPKEAKNGPFECPLCFMIVVATNKISWK
jgi:hypothetical protein